MNNKINIEQLDSHGLVNLMICLEKYYEFGDLEYFKFASNLHYNIISGEIDEVITIIIKFNDIFKYYNYLDDNSKLLSDMQNLHFKCSFEPILSKIEENVVEVYEVTDSYISYGFDDGFYVVHKDYLFSEIDYYKILEQYNLNVIKKYGL